MNAWFEQRHNVDTFVKLNVGSGKTLVGLLLLQSSLNEGVEPAIYISPDKQLVGQVLDEARQLGIEATDEPDDIAFQSGAILVTTVHRLFNGKSIFGVGKEGIKLRIGSIVIDDVHACINTISGQFRIELPNTHEAYQEIFRIVEPDLQKQNYSRYLDIKDSDRRATMEVPYWTWIDQYEKIVRILHEYKDDNSLKFTYPLLESILDQCRCIFSGQKLEIEPVYPPTDLIRAFSRARRRIYMTATLGDDSVLFTHFKANLNTLSHSIVPKSSQSMGERMILMPQELNPDIGNDEIRGMLAEVAKRENVVVIVPSKSASIYWKDTADQILTGENVIAGVEKLRTEHVGLTVLINRYDGIDLPGSACRVLAIVGLPEVTSLVEHVDTAVLGESKAGLRRQMQRVEQGMGRGIRSNDDYCVVLLVGEKLIRRIRSLEGVELLTATTKAQLELSRSLAKQLTSGSKEVDIGDIKDVMENCLKRHPGWMRASRQRLVNVREGAGLRFDDTSIAMHSAFNNSRIGEHIKAAEILNSTVNGLVDNDEKAWLLEKLAATKHRINRSQSQETLLAAYRLNSNVLKPLEGISYQKLSPHTIEQAAAVQSHHKARFLEPVDRLLFTKDLVKDLHFSSVPPDRFESAIDAVAAFIGLKSERPEKKYREGPDNLWAFPDGSFLIIECKNGTKSERGISKSDVGQLGQSIEWFKSRYLSENAVPIIIHPHRTLELGASSVAKMRVITDSELERFRENLLKHPLKFYKMANILLYSLCSSSSAANSSINGRNRCVGQLGICSYSMSPCRNNE